MAYTEEKFNKQMAIADLKLEEIWGLAASEETEDVSIAYERIGELIKRLEKSKDATTEYLMASDKVLEYIKQWTTDHKGLIQPFQEARIQIRKQMEEITEREAQVELDKQLHIQQKINEEQTRFKLQKQKEIEEATIQQQQREEEWYRQKLDFEKRIGERQAERIEKENTTKPAVQSVKLQKYTITPFTGDYKDWLRFWNQFTVEVDGLSIVEISKFNYLLELVKGKPKDDILGLPHTDEGYQEAKRIIVETYGKDIKVYKALIKELEELPAITSIHKLLSTSSTTSWPG